MENLKQDAPNVTESYGLVLVHTVLTKKTASMQNQMAKKNRRRSDWNAVL